MEEIEIIFSSLSEKLKKAIRDEKTVEISFIEGNVYVVEDDYLVMNRLVVRIDDKKVFDRQEEIGYERINEINNRATFLWKLYGKLMDEIYDYCFDLAVKEAKKHSFSRNHIKGVNCGFILFMKDNSKCIATFCEDREEHEGVTHMYYTKFYKPEVFMLT